jgi:radical SAM-linked protein
LVLLKFRIWGNLRFLSHAETMKVFQRACARAGVDVAHTEGFNPRPRLSLPLPRSVGVESDEELLAFVVRCDDGEDAAVDLEGRVRRRLSEQLPEGCEILSCTAVRGARAPLPRSAVYLLAVRPEYLGEQLRNRIKDLLASETLVLRRRVDEKASRFKDVDVRSFLKSIELKNGCVSVECEISSCGSIRVEEILDILSLDVAQLARPIKRTSVQWSRQ